MFPAVRIQHYVPQFYLRQFAQKKGKNYYVKCFDKTELRSFVANINRVACEANFFDPPESNHTTERWLARLETRFAKSYHRLIGHQELKRLSASDRVAISNFVSVQWLRTLEHREFIRDLITQVKHHLEEKNVTGQLRHELEMMSQDGHVVSFQIEDMRTNVSQVVRIIQKMKWILAVNNTKLPFWTSDNPITRYNPVAPSHPFKGNLGLLNVGIQVHFPLTPRLSLLLCDPIAYCHFSDTVNVELENVVFHNELQVDWSTRFLFSSDDDFSLARARIEKHPEAGRIGRQRVKTD